MYKTHMISERMRKAKEHNINIYLENISQEMEHFEFIYHLGVVRNAL